MTTAYDAIDDFAGPGGWDLGAALIGLDTLGIEWDAAACATARAAGFAREQADVSTHDATPYRGKVPLYISSPPCTLFSTAGKGTGRAAIGVLADGIRRMFAGDDCRAEVREVIYLEHTLPARLEENDARTPAKRWPMDKVEKAARDDAFVAALVLEPARRIMQLGPERVAMEQVPAVLPLWDVYAYELRLRGWSVWTGVVNAADYGVPQTRKRAIFMASRVSTVAPPVPTHAEHPDDGDLFGDGRAKWVSMADALGIGFEDEPAATISSGGGKTGGAEPFANASYRKRLAGAIDRRTNSKAAGGRMAQTALVSIERPAPTVTSMTGRQWVLRMGNQQNAAVRTLDEPAPTVLFGHRSNSVEWIRTRPATTVAGDHRIQPPGHKINAADLAAGRDHYDGRAGQNAVKISVAEGGVLQSFPWNFPWHGTKTKQFEQVGNAVPPLLAAHILAALTGRALELAA